MAFHRRFSSAFEARTEVKSARPETSHAGGLIPAVPALNEVLTKIGPVPAQALFLGIASDGLPVLLNLHDPHSGPMLITADAGAGKTAFLQTIARALTQTHSPGDVRYGVITNYPDEWESIDGTPHRTGIFTVGHSSAAEFIHSLTVQAHAKKIPQQSILLLVDDLESIATLDSQAVQNFRWLLLRGPARRVWPIVTLNAPRYEQVISWLQNFRSRVFGRVANVRVAGALADGNAPLDQLEPGVDFALREREDWLRFWLPSC